ncbi:MAG: hypothetical protein Athens071416_607 [Parcubacteria group bacterium Athens0714_16]|nr:MAG: hypothetical protein Athens071416_607 [Parcubacteria group bacterium Athens0714_16]
MKTKLVFATAAELCGGKEDDWFCIAAVLASGYAKHYRPARNISHEEVCKQLITSFHVACILANNPYLDEDDQQYKLKYASTNYESTEFSGVNGWLENTVGGKALFAFLVY